ncbi:DUF790 family protein, partial [Candidatus Bathyarchaeota archaeon]
MLPPEHIRARRRKGVIRLLYASEEHVSLAETLISVHEDHRDKSRGVLKEALSDCEMLGYDFKLVRGLSAVLEGRCVYESLAVLNPVKAREAVFGETGRRVIATEEERTRAMAAAAFRLGVSTMDLERSLYADLMDEQVLTDFEGVPPLDLLKEYNFALTVGLLAHARRLELSYEGVDGEIEDAAAKLGSSTVSKSRRGSKVVVEWRPTSRIGYKAMHLEAVLGRLLSHGGWGLSADVVYPLKSGKGHSFEVSGGVHGGMMKPGFVREGLVSLEKPSRADAAPRPRGKVVVVADVARRLRITEDEVMEMYRDGGLVDVGGVLFKEEKRDEIVEALEGASDLRFGAVRALL